jgi:hypothetical protein
MNPNDISLTELQYPNVPSHTIEALENYWTHGWEPGGFLTAVLYNDLYTAAMRADHWNKGALGYIVEYLVNEAPDGSYGSEYKVKDWCRKGAAFQQHEKRRLVDILSTS